jgi:hypothetical protein
LNTNNAKSYVTSLFVKMTEDEKWEYINRLEEELLLGGVVLSEWTTFLAKDAETAFCSGAYLASILASQAAIESHLRYDYFSSMESKRWGFYDLIERSDLKAELKMELHDLRSYRNKWVHVNDPSNDNDLLNRPEYFESELFAYSKKAIKTMLKILFSNPAV